MVSRINTILWRDLEDIITVLTNYCLHNPANYLRERSMNVKINTNNSIVCVITLIDFSCYAS